MDYLRRQRLAFDSPERQAVYDNFQANLSDICDIIRHSGARGVVAALAVNLRDFPPLGSLHRRDLPADLLAQWEKSFQAGVAAEGRGEFAPALAHFQSAARLDDHYAELHYRLARCAEATEAFDLARQHYSLARDWDALQFRGDSRLNRIVRAVATRPQLYYVDVEQALLASGHAPHGVVGKELFHEHVHFTFEGDYQTARALLPTVVTALGLPASSASIPS